MSDTERLEELVKVTTKDMFLFPEPEQYPQCGYNIHLVGRMRQDEGNDMLFRYLILVPDTFCSKMMQELTQIQTIVANRYRTATQSSVR